MLNNLRPGDARWRLFRQSSVGFLFALGLFACRPSQQGVPQVAVASSREAQEELTNLELRWESEGIVGRRALREDLERYVSKYPFDTSRLRAQLMLAQIALLERRSGGARALLQPLVEGDAGPSRDEAILLLAAVENREGEHQVALELLAPLEGKLLKDSAKDQYARERTNAAIHERRWRLAIVVMTSWLVELKQESTLSREWIHAHLAQIPHPAILHVLADYSSKYSSEKERASRQWMRKVLITQLTIQALGQRDAYLAKDLLSVSPAWLRVSEDGDQLAELAALARLAEQQEQVVGRVLGVVLGGKSPQQRRRSLRVMAGLARGLGLGQGSGERQSVGVVAVEDRGSLKVALSTLSGLGASVLLAGVDAESAHAALQFAESKKVPVVTFFGEPERNSHFGFALGSSIQAQTDAMKTWAQGKGEWAFLGNKDFHCEPHQERPGALHFPIEKWKNSGVSFVGILGGRRCVKNFLMDLRFSKWSPQIVVGLAGAHGRYAEAFQLKSLRASAFPRNQRQSPGNRISNRERAPSSEAHEHRTNDWFYSLGFDAAHLLRAALQSLPDTEVTEMKAVKIRHDQVRRALLDVRVSLKTTVTQGFMGTHGIARNLVVSSWGSATDEEAAIMKPSSAEIQP